IFVLFNDTATTEICPLSLHDALPISFVSVEDLKQRVPQIQKSELTALAEVRSEEHTAELQSHSDLVCHLLLEKKNLTYAILTVLPPLGGGEGKLVDAGAW